MDLIEQFCCILPYNSFSDSSFILHGADEKTFIGALSDVLKSFGTMKVMYHIQFFPFFLIWNISYFLQIFLFLPRVESSVPESVFDNLSYNWQTAAHLPQPAGGMR